MRVSLVVPAHNEEGTLRTLVERVLGALSSQSFNHELELLLVDDNSTDATGEICDELAKRHEDVEVLHRTANPGFGSAIKAGLREATGDVLIPFMGDLSDSPEDVPNLVDAIEDGADVALGSRFVEGGNVEGYPPLKLFYNRAFNNLIRLAFGIRAKDITNAFTAYRREVIEEIGIDNLDSESFDLTAELPLRAHIAGFRSVEVPVTWKSREAGVSKLNATQKGPVYLKRLLHLFILGNIAGLRDLAGVVKSGSPLRVVSAALLGIAILVALFSITGYEEVFTTVANADLVWLAAAGGAYITSFTFRTWRYRVLLRTGGHLATRGGVFRAITLSWFVNFLIPARAGDAVRGLALKSTEEVPFGVATGLVVVERILDMLTLGSVMLLVAWLFLETERANILALGAIGIALILTIGLVMIYLLDERVVAMFESRYPKIRAGTEALNEALERTVRNPYAMALAGLLSIPVWTLEASTVFFSARAIGLSIGAVPTLTAAVAAFVSQAVPLTPAGIGTYEASIAAILSLFGVPGSAGTALGLVDHFVRVAVVYIIGPISAVHIGFRSRAYFREQGAEDGDNLAVEN